METFMARPIETSFDDTDTFLLDHLSTLPGELEHAAAKYHARKRRARWTWGALFFLGSMGAGWLLMQQLR
jgi:hypothetical protein